MLALESWYTRSSVTSTVVELSFGGEWSDDVEPRTNIALSELNNADTYYVLNTATEVKFE